MKPTPTLRSGYQANSSFACPRFVLYSTKLLSDFHPRPYGRGNLFYYKISTCPYFYNAMFSFFPQAEMRHFPIDSSIKPNKD